VAATRSGTGGAALRTCIGCRKRAPKAQLMRIVLRNGAPVLDLGQRMEGRGAYLCRKAQCFAEATRKRGLGRSFRTGFQDGVSLTALWDLVPELGRGSGVSAT